MFRKPGAGRSKATASTLCQKCLKRGHYSYECTVTAQERPYKPRPSRTQQLLNPKLQPKLTTDVPNDLLRKKGVAEEILTKKEEDRGRKAIRDSQGPNRKRSRSMSSYSSDSVSTISTNRSPSRSPSHKRQARNGTSSLRGGRGGKRERSSVSMSSQDDGERNTRRRMSSFSPDTRGRRRRSVSSHMSHDHNLRDHPRSGRMEREENASRGRGRWRSRSRDATRHRTGRTEGRSISRSISRGSTRMQVDSISERRGSFHGAPLSHTARSRSRSRELQRFSPPRSPDRGSRHHHKHGPPPRRSPSPFRAANGGHGGDAYPSKARFAPHLPPAARGVPAPQTQRERSLSPYSKRVAMTQTMQR